MIVEVRIANKKYQLNCQEQEHEKILEYADLLDQRIVELKEDLTDVGNENSVIWTCDLNEEYIKINKDYRS